MNNKIKIKILLGVMLLWGIITGRTLPQWKDISNSPLCTSLIYWLLISIGVIVIWQSHKIIKPT